MPGVGDVAMEVQLYPEEVTPGCELAESFDARHLTRFVTTPNKKGGADISLQKTFLGSLGATSGHAHVQASSLAWWALASADAVEKLRGMWSPVIVPEGNGAVLRGPGAR